MRQIFRQMVMAVLVAASVGCGGGSVDVAGIVALRGVVSEVHKALSETVSQTDQAVDNEIRRSETAAKGVLDRMDKIVKDGTASVAREREEAARQAFEVLAESNRLVSKSGSDLFERVNLALAAGASVLDRIPFVDIPDTVFAVSPYRMRENATDLQVSLFGYFPSIATDAQAIRASVNGESVEVKRDIGKVYFQIPAAALQKPPSATVKIELPKRGWFGSAPTPIETPIRLLRSQPYTFLVEFRKANPGAFTTVTGGAHSESTNNSSRPHLDAERLFNLTVPNPERYEAGTAKISGVAVVSQGGGKPCEDCPDPNGRITGWNDKAIDLELNAPSCGGHVVDKGWLNKYFCGGGGSNYQITVAASFFVRVKGEAETQPAGTTEVKAGWESVSSVPVPEGWASALVRLSYDDNFDKRESVVVVEPLKPTAAAAMFAARFAEGKLLLTTQFVGGSLEAGEGGTRSARGGPQPVEIWRLFKFE